MTAVDDRPTAPVPVVAPLAPPPIAPVPAVGSTSSPGARRLAGLQQALRRYPAIAVGVVAAVGAPLVLSGYYTSVAASLAIISMVLLSIVVLTGFVGQISLGQASLMGVGAFASGFLTNRLGLPVFLAVPLAGLLTVPFSMLIGLPAVLLRGLTLAVVTLLFASAMALVFKEPDVIAAMNEQTGFGGDAITGVAVPKPDVSGDTFYWVCLAFLLGLMVVARNIRSGRTGRLFVAVREGEDTVPALGTSAAKVKLVAFGTSAFFAGIGGSLFAHSTGSVTWIDFNVFQSIFFFAIVAVAGIESIPGAVLAAALLLLPDELAATFGIDDLGTYSQLVTGALLILTTLFLPRGLVSTSRVLRNALGGRRDGTGGPSGDPLGDALLVPPAASSTEH